VHVPTLKLFKLIQNVSCCFHEILQFDLTSIVISMCSDGQYRFYGEEIRMNSLKMKSHILHLKMIRILWSRNSGLYGLQKFRGIRVLPVYEELYLKCLDLNLLWPCSLFVFNNALSGMSGINLNSKITLQVVFKWIFLFQGFNSDFTRIFDSVCGRAL